MSAVTTHCSVTGCALASSGQCKLGKKPDQCEERRKLADSEFISIPSGLELDGEGASAILRRDWARVIILAGGVKSGKTTLIASLYQQFQDGPFAQHNFAGSDTLHAWERYCHPSRTASMASQADTVRTQLESTFVFAHLRLRPLNSCRPATDYLFSNVSGELFEAMRDNPQECARAGSLSRADRFLLLLDGDKLVAPATRASVIADARTLVRRLLDTRALGAAVPIDLLASKWDQVVAAKVEGVVAGAMNQLVNALRTHSTPPQNIDWFRLAARPTTAEQTPVGLSDVLSRCLSSETEPIEPPALYKPPESAHGILRFRGRHL
jgi:hypothetical protein